MVAMSEGGISVTSHKSLVTRGSYSLSHESVEWFV